MFAARWANCRRTWPCIRWTRTTSPFWTPGWKPFLDAVERPRLRRELTVWKHWRKILPAPHAADSHEGLPDMHDFRRNRWVEDGIFSDVCPDDFSVRGLIVHDADRLRRPVWGERPP